jgi:hypothetical protein
MNSYNKQTAVRRQSLRRSVNRAGKGRATSPDSAMPQAAANPSTQGRARDPAASGLHGHARRSAATPAGEQIVQEAMDYHKRGLNAFQVPRGYLIRLFARIEQLGDSIEAAFAGRLSLPDLPPHAPENRRRLRAYVSSHKEVTNLFEHALGLWMITFGMKPEDDWVPIVVEDMRLKHAAEMLKPRRRED